MRITLRMARWLAPWLLAWTPPLLANIDLLADPARNFSVIVTEVVVKHAP